jgi:hypothetical protein
MSLSWVGVRSENCRTNQFGTYKAKLEPRGTRRFVYSLPLGLHGTLLEDNHYESLGSGVAKAACKLVIFAQ